MNSLKVKLIGNWIYLESKVKKINEEVKKTDVQGSKRLGIDNVEVPGGGDLRVN